MDVLDGDMDWFAVPAPRKPVQSEERRRQARVNLGLPVRLRSEEGGRPVTVVLRDVSLTGAFLDVVAPLRLPVGARIAIGLVLGDGRTALARGRVVRHEGTGLGMAIDETTEAFRNLLDCNPL